MTSKNNFKHECTQSMVKNLGCINSLCPKDEAFVSDTNTNTKFKKSQKFINITLNKHQQNTPPQSLFVKKLTPSSTIVYETASHLKFETPSKVK